MAEVSPYLVILAGAVATYLWRAVGVVLAGRIAPTGAAIEWVTCVAYALLAGLIARMIILPIGPLAESSLLARGLATALALGVFFLARRNVLLGVAAGSGGLAAWSWLAG